LLAAYAPLNAFSGAKWIKRLTQDRLGQFVGDQAMSTSARRSF
jgi:hypothetical protein